MALNNKAVRAVEQRKEQKNMNKYHIDKDYILQMIDESVLDKGSANLVQFVLDLM